MVCIVITTLRATTALWSTGVKADKAIATYRRMRVQPLWRMLASNSIPTVIGLLHAHLYESERSLPTSIFTNESQGIWRSCALKAKPPPKKKRHKRMSPASSPMGTWSDASRLGLQRRNMNSPPLPSKPFGLSLTWRSRTQPPDRVRPTGGSQFSVSGAARLGPVGKLNCDHSPVTGLS